MKAALSRGSAVFCFLYEDGVLLADRTRDVPQGEDDPSRQLAELTSSDPARSLPVSRRRNVAEFMNIS